TEYRNKIVGKIHDDVPEQLKDKDDAVAYFGVINEVYQKISMTTEELENLAVDTALATDEIIQSAMKVNFFDDENAVNTVINEIEDYLFDEIRDERSVKLTEELMDDIIERVMGVAESRYGK
ncbi:restriction endonuclease subunit R, partial [bacterium]|nr:restriction endonuclease subunit R [bacterium]